jgi:hypothetical protein
MVDDSQALVSYLWPIDGRVAVAFGALLMTELLSGNSYFGSYQNALSVLVNGNTCIRDAINKIPELGEDGLRYINPEAADWSSILRWGSPVFLE